MRDQQRSVWVSIVVYLTTGAALTGCGSRDIGDLEVYAHQVLARKGGQIEPLPEMKPYERYLYQSAQSGVRDPFEPFYKAHQEQLAVRRIILSKPNTSMRSRIATGKNSSNSSSTACAWWERYRDGEGFGELC